MVKADPNRDYYGDLQVPPTADIQEIKKQYKKLALKYHPDRNPGKDQSEVNAKFQVIQSAHEVLIDVEQRRVYDAARARQAGRYGSGVKGNPWAGAGSQYPAPPKRTAPTARNPPSSGANKYREFTTGGKTSAKSHAREETAEAKEETYKAWENMRRPKPSQAQQSSSSKAEPRPSKPAGAPPTTPRTPSARQKQEAAFGNRRPGYYPRSPVTGDEPPASSKSYASNPAANLFREATTQATRAREREAREGNVDNPENIFDARQRTPYQTHGGEKTNPFDGVPVRARSTRESPHRDGSLSPDKDYSDQRPRSSSEASPGLRASRGKGRPSTSAEQPSPKGTSFASRSRPKHAPEDYKSKPASSQFQTGSKESDVPRNSQSNGTTPMYEDRYSQPGAQSMNPQRAVPHPQSGTASFTPSRKPASSWGPQLYPVERTQKAILQVLIKKASPAAVGETQMNGSKTTSASVQPNPSHANECDGDRFDFASEDDMFASPPKSRSPFMSTSAEGMSTKFAEDGGPFQFSAGSDSAEPLPRRSKSSSRLGRQSTPKPAHPGPQNGFTNGQAAPAAASPPPQPPPPPPPPPPPAFDPTGWSEKIGPQDFVPQPSKTTSQSPTRASRSTSKKPRTRPTMGTAAMTNDSSEEEFIGRRGRFEEPVTMDSPNAMDIDSPPREPDPPKRQKPDPAGARNIPVEPSKPEWRPGTAGEAKDRTKQAQAQAGSTPYKAPAAGSEDADEFRASFTDWKNVAPFSSPGPGLKGFAGDLKANLPFESQPSEHIPIKTAAKSIPRVLIVPTPPAAPPLPAPFGVNGIRPTKEVLQSYLRQFQSYLLQWENWNSIIVKHFAQRNTEIQTSRNSKGLGFMSDSSVKEQLTWMTQDKEVRAKWTRACDEHEKRLEEFLTIRGQL